jgi:hypothetical protein
MSRKCTVCSDPQRELVDDAIVGGVAYRRIAAHHDLAEASVRRHAAAHLPATLVRATEAAEVSRADILLSQADALRAEALNLLEEARNRGDLRTAVAAIGQARGVLELLARPAGELSDTRVNVVVSAEWVEMRTLILDALEPFPEARAAVSGALSEDVA